MDWYYQESGTQVGPLTDNEFENSVRQGKVRGDTLVWNESLRGWQPYQTVARSGNEVLPTVTQRCANCLRDFPEQDMVRYQNSYVCASCKPIFFQRLKEGGAVPGTMEYGGFWPRAGAKVIDHIILSAVNMIFMFSLIFSSFGFSANMRGEPSPLQIFMFIAAYGLIFVFSVGYSVWFLVKYGATPGKMALGLKVITAEGSPISVGRAFGRFFAELLSAMICYIGYIMVAFDKEERKALHDILCNTRVVRK
jgi:uncharacterized RDD family membrane protein YckC